MPNQRLAPALVAATFLVLGCADQSPDPLESSLPEFAKGGAAACPIPADVVVSDEGSLLAALAAASPGDVIGLDGFFAVTASVNVTTDDVTLTCATPGSGLYAQPGAGVWQLIISWGTDGVAVDRLVLDASAARAAPYWGGNGRGLRFTNNTVTCGPQHCAFFGGSAPGAPGAIVADNYFESHGSITGVHLQGWPYGRIDGARVERNTVVALAPQTIFGGLGGIRVRDGSEVLVAGNEVRGPWNNSIHGAALTNSQFKSNTLEGAVWDGIALWNVFNSVFRNNKATAAGEAGIFTFWGCDNVFLGNNLNGNANDWGAAFWPYAGANTLVGNQNVVVDDGDFDCDGDGQPDPNIITGHGAVVHDVDLGDRVSDAASGWKDIK